MIKELKEELHNTYKSEGAHLYEALQKQKEELLKHVCSMREEKMDDTIGRRKIDSRTRSVRGGIGEGI